MTNDVRQENDIARALTFVNIRFTFPKQNSSLAEDEWSSKANDKSQVRASKKLIDCDEMRKLNALAGKVRGDLTKVQGPFKHAMLREGIYGIPSARIPSVERYLTEIKEGENGWNDLVNRMTDSVRYEAIMADERKKLGPIFHESDYLTAGQLRRRFSMWWEYVTFSVPDSLQSVDAELYAKEIERVRERTDEVSAQVTDAMREYFLELISGVSKALEPAEDGKRKVFRAERLESLTNFLRDFNTMYNPQQDGSLAELVTRTRGLMEGKSVLSLRGDESLQQATRESLAAVQGELRALLVNPKSRKFRVRQEDELEHEESAA